MNNLFASYKLPSPTAAKFSTPHQVEGGEVAKKLGAKTDRDYSQVVRLFKHHPDAARRAYSFVADADARKPLALFFWKAKEILNAYKQAKLSI